MEQVGLHCFLLVFNAASILHLENDSAYVRTDGTYLPYRWWAHRVCMCVFLAQGGLLTLCNHSLWWVWLVVCVYLNAHKLGLGLGPGRPAGPRLEFALDLRLPVQVPGRTVEASSRAMAHIDGASPERQRMTTAPTTWKIPDEALFYGERGMAPAFMDYLAHHATGDQLNLAGLGLRVMAPETFQTRTEAGAKARDRLQSLFLNDNLLTVLPKGVLKGLVNLRVLYLDGNQIGSLLHHPFKRLHSLEDLHLGRNRLRDIPAKTFAGLSKLKTLAMGANTLGTLPGGVFKDLSSLTVLWLDDCRLESLPVTVFVGLHKLEKLMLQSNYLAALPAAIFRNLTQLLFLNLEANPMEKLPADIYVGIVAMLAERTKGISPCFRNGWELAWRCHDAHKRPGHNPQPMRADFHYKGPCWDDGDAMVYDEKRGAYFLVWPPPVTAEDYERALDIEGIEESPSLLGEREGGGGEGEVVRSGAVWRVKYDVHYLVQGDFFCGILGGDVPRKRGPVLRKDESLAGDHVPLPSPVPPHALPPWGGGGHQEANRERLDHAGGMGGPFSGRVSPLSSGAGNLRFMVGDQVSAKTTEGWRSGVCVCVCVCV